MNNLSGYTELELAGKILPFKFGTNAWSLFCEKHKLDFYGIFKCGIFGKFDNVDGKEVYKAEPDIFKLMDIYYFAHVTAQRVKKEQPMCGYEEFTALMDETPEAMFKLQEVLLQSRIMGYTLTGLAEEGEKGNFPKT